MADNADQGRLQDDIESLREDLAKVKGDIREIADTLVNMGRHQAQQMSDRVSHQVESGLDSIQEYVERRPVATLAMAFGVGLLAGKLFGR
jgi:ElaB/YqjD/DUF883 family membrane-anchored ribosome-binding protein